MFPDVELIRAVRSELDTVVEEGVQNIVQLLRNAESGSSSGAAMASGSVDEDAFEAKNRKISQYKRWVHGQKQQGDGSSSEGSGDEVDATSDTTKLAKGEEGGTTRADMDISSGGKLTQHLGRDSPIFLQFFLSFFYLFSKSLLNCF
jgi:hypothetical protein